MDTIDNITYVSESKIHGKGLFARTNILKDTIIGEITGSACQRNGPYVLWLSNTEGFKVDCDLKYINHADQPNASYYDDLTVVALRNIKAGEEITHNYESSDW